MFSQCNMTQEIFWKVCTWHAEKMQAQALVKVLNFTFCCGRGLNGVTTFTHLFLPSWEVERSAPCISFSSGRGEGASLVDQLFLSHFLLLPPSLTMNLLVLRDPSRSKQAVTSASSLKRKGCQNLNIYSMQCETKILVLLVSLFWGLFIAVPCVFLGVVQQNKTSPKQKALLGLRFSSPSASCSAYSMCMFLCLS